MRNISANLQQQAGQGDAYVFSPFDNSNLLNALSQRNDRNDKKAKLQAEHDKELRDKLDYNPKAIWSPLQERHKEKVFDVLKHGAKLKASPVEFNHPDRIEYENKKARIEQDINKGNELEKAYLAAHGRAKSDPYYHMDKVQNELNNTTFGEDRKGLKSVDDLSISDYEKPFANPENFNMTHAAQSFTKDLPEQVKSYISQQKNDQGERFNENIVKSKFYKYDNSGNQIKDSKGNPVINITPETKHAFYNSHPLIEPYIQKEMEKPENKGKSEDQILQSIISPYAIHQSNKNIGALTKNGNGDSDKTTFTRSYNKPRITTTKNRGTGEQKAIEGNVPEVVTPVGSKMNKVIPLTPNKIYDEDTNSEIAQTPGIKNIQIVEFQNRYFEPSTGKYLHGTKESMEKLVKEGKAEKKWVGVGNLIDDDKNVSGHVFIPYDAISNEIEAQYGIKPEDIEGKEADPYGVKEKKSPLSKIK